MSLDQIFEAMHDFVVGRASLDATAGHLGIDAAAAQRLRIYRRGYSAAIAGSAAVLFPITQQLVIARAGEDAWNRLVDAVGTDHPTSGHRFLAAPLVTLLGGPIARDLALPAWLGELADLEVSERRVFGAPDVALPDQLCVVAPLALRPYRFDVFSVRTASDPTTVVPAERTNLVAVWRTPDHLRFTKPLGSLAVRILRAIHKDGARGFTDLLATPGISRSRVIEAARNLREIGLLRGDRAQLGPIDEMPYSAA